MRDIKKSKKYSEMIKLLNSLEIDYYNFDDVTKSLRGERKGKIFKLGQKVRVVVTNASKENSTIDFNLAEDNKNGNTK